MLTPKQKESLRIFSERPITALLISRFDLVPTPSPEFIRNEKIAERVDTLLEQIKMEPRRPRKITYPRKPWDEPDLSSYKDGLTCPF